MTAIAQETGTGAGSARPAEPVESSKAHGLGASAERVPSPRAPAPVLSLVATARPSHGDEAGSSGEVLDDVEEIGREPPNHWDAFSGVARTFLRRGDKVDVVEEKEVDPQVKQLRATLVAVNEQFEVSQPIPRYVDIECMF